MENAKHPVFDGAKKRIEELEAEVKELKILVRLLNRTSKGFHKNKDTDKVNELWAIYMNKE